MKHLHYFHTGHTQESLELGDSLCASCGATTPGDSGWWAIGMEGAGERIHCTPCTFLAEEVAEAAGEPLVLGQIETIGQQDARRAWLKAGISTS